MNSFRSSKDLTLSVLVLNAENLFLLFDEKLDLTRLPNNEADWQKLSSSIYENKPLKKCQDLAQLIMFHQPNLLMLCEVGGYESLHNFNQLFLNSAYSVALVEGNSDRNIDVGFLIKRDMGFFYDIYSNRNKVISPQGLKFSRDVAELHLFIEDRNKPFLIFLLTHLKSHLDPDRSDPMGFERRTTELNALLDIYQNIERKMGYKIPIAVAGDFNGNAVKSGTSMEFLNLYKNTQLLDVCELAQLPSHQRITFYQMSRTNQNRVEGKQLDYCFLNPRLAQHLDSSSVSVLPYPNYSSPPDTFEEKLKLPSDHYPLFFTLRNIPGF